MSPSESSGNRRDGDVIGRMNGAEIEQELQLILASPRFADSPRLSAFLRYIVEAKLAGEEERIQEYTIGVEVFGRGQSFDPRLDSIVRVEARRLRDRLSEYNATNGGPDSVTIELPRRGYIPRFLSNGSKPRLAGGLLGKRDGRGIQTVLRDRRLWWAAALVTAACLVGILFLRPPPPAPDGVVAFSLSPPLGGSLLTPYRGGGPALSPDGRHVVFVARDENGKTCLYLRSLDRAPARPLEGTEDAKWPFWSPNGSQVGFAAQGKLKIADIERGDVWAIADAPSYRGGTWSDFNGGLIVFAAQRGPLLRVPVHGGAPRVAMPLQDGEREHRDPVFLPDGKRILYTVHEPGKTNDEIRLADLESNSSTRLFDAQSAVKYAETPSGSFLVSSKGPTLLAREFDLHSLEVSAAALPLLSDLPLAGLGIFSFSVSGRVLAYFHGPFPVGRGRLVWRSRTGQRLGSPGDTDNYLWVSLSPDEQKVAAAISHGQADVWTIDLATSVATRRTEDPSLDRTPIWSPDGRQLLISSDRAGDGGRIYVVSAEGSAEVKPWLDYPADGEFSDWPSQWHGKTSTVLFFRLGNDGHDVWEKRPGQAPRRLISGLGGQLNARLSPDARHIAYVSNALGGPQVFLSTYPNAEGRVRVSPHGGNYPLWKGDGTELYYVSRDGTIMAAEVSADRLLKASSPRPLFRVQFPVTPAVTVYQYAVTKNGQRFLTVEETQPPEATVVLNWDKLLAR
jgi:eukaryotic-like serine/threonine-protein kinase